MWWDRARELCECGVVADWSGHKKSAGMLSLSTSFPRFFSKWGGKRDLNARPSEPQSDALTN